MSGDCTWQAAPCSGQRSGTEWHSVLGLTEGLLRSVFRWAQQHYQALASYRGDWAAQAVGLYVSSVMEPMPWSDSVTPVLWAMCCR